RLRILTVPEKRPGDAGFLEMLFGGAMIELHDRRIIRSRGAHYGRVRNVAHARGHSRIDSIDVLAYSRAYPRRADEQHLRATCESSTKARGIIEVSTAYQRAARGKVRQPFGCARGEDQ